MNRRRASLALAALAGPALLAAPAAAQSADDWRSAPLAIPPAAPTDTPAPLQQAPTELRRPQLPLQPGQQALVSVAMAKVLGHAALGLCESERPLALNLDEAELPKGATLMICPIGCTAKARPTGLLVALYDRPSTASLSEPLPAGNALAARELLQRRQREQLMLLSHRLGQLLEDQ